jgi:patatin-like phospholipase/acyl hydrolase
MEQQRFRILALDGGGIKGTFSAAVLAEWEKETGLRVADHFDLIAGTSTGGILAIGLGLGLSAEELLEFYKKRGALIFPVVGLHRRLWRTLRALIIDPAVNG